MVVVVLRGGRGIRLRGSLWLHMSVGIHMRSLRGRDLLIYDHVLIGRKQVMMAL